MLPFIVFVIINRGWCFFIMLSFWFHWYWLTGLTVIFFFCCEKLISLYILIYNKTNVVALYIYRKISLLDLVCCSWWWQTKILHTMVLLSSSPSWVEMKKTLSRLTSKEYWQQLLHWTEKWGITIYFMLR